MNERITEDIVREILKENKKKYTKVKIHEQKVENNPRVEKLLKNASKQGSGVGKPEFIITFDEISDLIIVMECKADIKKHESKDRNKPKDFAVDGVLLYSSYLSKEFNVIAIGVSGEKKSELKVSTFLQLLKSDNIEEKPDKKILSFIDYLEIYKEDPEKQKIDLSNLLKYSRKLHNELRDNAKLIESEKPLLVSAILMSLHDPSFAASFKKEPNSENLAINLVDTVSKILRNANLPQNKIDAMKFAYEFIKNNSELTRQKDKDGNHVNLLQDIIFDIEKNVVPFVGRYEFDDVIGRFFGEFLRYTGGDKQGLGIVLTPKHVTELFSDLAHVTKDDIVFDNCCGTGGFLISAMKKMILDAGNDTSKIEHIKKNQLIGIEDLPNMFALACANMILRGDGKANIYKGNCFEMIDTIKTCKCTVGLLNPPYSQKGEDLHELEFVLNCLDSLEKNSTCIAIVPISCVTIPSTQKEKLLQNHTLESVMSMPEDLFYPVGAVTCIMVFKAKVPHNSEKNTWFGYWKNDGFVKRKHEGRVDYYKKWDEIKKKWLKDYVNKKDVSSNKDDPYFFECISKNVTAEMEWCAEAYMETDYSKITKDEYLKMVKEYTVHKIRDMDF